MQAQISTSVLSVAFALTFAIRLGAQEPTALNDQRIVDLIAMGVSQQEIVRMIGSTPKFDFDLKPESTQAMLKFGVSEEVMKAMAARESGQSFSLPARLANRPGPTIASNFSGPTPALSSGTAQIMAPVPTGILEVGAYYQGGGQWTEMMPEVGNW